MRPSAILFDLDGVLIRSEEVWAQVVREAGEKFRGRPVSHEEFMPTFGQGTAADVAAFGFQCTPAELDAFYAVNFRQHITGIWVDPDARGLLAQLQQEAVRLAVVTNTIGPLARDLLTVAGLLPFFQVVSTPDLVPRAKPAPDLVLHALNGLALSPEQAWFVGDSRYDREASASAKVRFVGLRQEGDLRIENLSELARLLPFAR
ncbi:MAG: HAD family hydrolase [Myxococcota bacterium]|nr:HAD family hydrolase [Myxococcota bacterium]